MPATPVPELAPPVRLLLGPGPSPVHPRVYRAMTTPLLGHLDPKYLEIMGEVQRMLRTVFQTQNPLTLAVQGTGTAGMEAALVNLIEPGDKVVVGCAGVFSNRMAEIVLRAGGHLVRLESAWGTVFERAELEQALIDNAPVKALALVHAETSTGAQQPLEGLGALCHKHGALLVVDCVTSLGGLPVTADAWEADVIYSGSQKCLACPPGLAPITFSPRAMEAVKGRKRKVQSFYLDIQLLAEYWNESKPVYHHTGPITMMYALREGLRLVLEEGLEARFERHRRNSAALLAGAAVLGLRPQAQEGHRLPTLNCLQTPEGIAEAPVRRALLEEHGIEIGAGLGPLAGKVWRIGLMGEGSRPSSVVAVLTALEQELRKQGRHVAHGAAVGAALQAYERS